MIFIEQDGWRHWSTQYRGCIVRAIRGPKPTSLWHFKIDWVEYDGSTTSLPLQEKTIKSGRQAAIDLIKETLKRRNQCKLA